MAHEDSAPVAFSAVFKHGDLVIVTFARTARAKAWLADDFHECNGTIAAFDGVGLALDEATIEAADNRFRMIGPTGRLFLPWSSITCVREPHAEEE